jgi:hypothetical protein
MVRGCSDPSQNAFAYLLPSVLCSLFHRKLDTIENRVYATQALQARLGPRRIFKASYERLCLPSTVTTLKDQTCYLSQAFCLLNITCRSL